MGVTIVGIGIEHPQFAQVLGWSHVGTVGEIAPIGKTGYRMVHAFAVGRPEDLARLGNWVELRLSNSDDLPDVSEYPLITTFGQARGTLDSTSAVELLMEQLKSSIEGAYETRAEFQESMKNFKEN
ncbi:MAG: hypothetical protein HY741_01995 [Chloroflexi bacterium]|nr:hypothetical protein [Chloroflexota bacterium]